MKLLKPVCANRRGFAVAEFGLIAAMAGIAIAVAALALGSAAANSDLAATSCVEPTRC